MRTGGQRARREYRRSGSVESNTAHRGPIVEESDVSGRRWRPAVADSGGDGHRLPELRWIGARRQNCSGVVLEVDLQHRMQFNAIRSNARLSVFKVEEGNSLYLDRNVGGLEVRGCGQARVEPGPGGGDSRPQRTGDQNASRSRGIRRKNTSRIGDLRNQRMPGRVLQNNVVIDVCFLLIER